MLISQLAVQEKKSVWLQGQAEGIDAPWRSLPSLDREGDSAAVMLCICLSLGGGPMATVGLLSAASVALLFSLFTRRLILAATLPLLTAACALVAACCIHGRRLPSFGGE